MLDGKITINNPNFTMQKDKVNNNFIKDIDVNQNTISLNSIVYGNSVTLEIPIKFKKQEEFETNYFEKEINLLLSGNYKKEEKIETLNSEKQIKLYWTETNADVIFTQDIGRYIDLGENGILLEQNIQTEITNDSLPREKERIALQVPELNGQKPKVAYVILNGERLEEEKFQYRTEDGIVTISEVEEAKKTEDTEETKETYKWGLAKNQYEIIYIYGKEAGIGKTKVRLNSIVSTKLFTKEDIQKLDTKQDIEIEPRGSLVEIDKTITNEIYKGYLYQNSKENTLWEETLKIEIANANLVNSIRIEEKEEDNFLSNNNEKVTAKDMVYYKETTISKNDFERIFGQNGEIIFYENGIETIHINKDSVANENGYFVISYGEGVKNLKIETTKPESEGTFKIYHKKTIQNAENYTKKQLEKMEYLETKSILTTDTNIKHEISNKIKLNNTQTQAKFDIDKTSISTMGKNQEMQVKVVLNSNQNNLSLYDNPEIIITFPEEVKEIKILDEVRLLYEEELKINKVEIIENEIHIYLNGTQTKYKEAGIDGAELTFKANVVLDEKTTSKLSEITMIVKNHNEQAEAKKTIEIVSPREMITVNTIEELNVETVGEEAKKEVEIERKSKAKEVNVKSEVINNKQEEVNEVNILGILPTDGKVIVENDVVENNLSAKISSNIQVNGVDSKVYYTENENATEDLNNPENGWTEELTDTTKIKKYLVHIDNMQKDQLVSFEYKMAIPEDLVYNQQATEGYKVIYKDTSTGISNQVNSTYLTLSTGKGPELNGVLKAMIGNEEIKDNENINAGEKFTYQVEITNTGTEVAKNVKVEIPIPDGTTYLEEDADKAEKQIDTIEIGETKTIEFSLQAKPEISEKQQIISTATISYNEIVKNSNKLTNMILPADILGEVKLTITDQTTLTEGDVLEYACLITNRSSEDKNGVTLKWKIPENFEITEQFIPIDEFDKEYLETSEEVQIDLKANETKEIRILVSVESIEGVSQDLFVGASVIYADREYRMTPSETRTIYSTSNYEIKLSANKENEYVIPGEEIIYKLSIKNMNNIEIETMIEDQIPEQLTITEVTLDGQKQELSEEDGNLIRIMPNFTVGQTRNLEIKTVVNYKEGTEGTETIVNKAAITGLNKTIESNEVTHIIDRSYHPIDPDPDPNPDPDPGENTYYISGRVWIDENKNGMLEDEESKFPGIEVKIIDVDTNQTLKDSNNEEIKAVSNEEGFYELAKIPKGKYLVVFSYNSSQYTLTQYKQTGVEESRNSDVIMKKLNFNGEEKVYGTTDVIEITDNNIANINMGLVKTEEFDLKLDKTISRVVVQKPKSTNVYSYEGEKLAKIEIDAKELDSAIVTVDYSIKVSNVGQVDGYVKEIADYLPEGWQIVEKTDNEWHKEGNAIYYQGFSNEKILPGESKEITVTITKNMNSESTGIYKNTAEIQESYNESNITDINSTPGNQKEGENDISSAELIISIRTGKAIIYTSIILISISILAVGIFIIKKKILGKKD